MKIHKQFHIRYKYSITVLIVPTISITNSSVSQCVNRSGPVSILEELMKVFQSEYLFSIYGITN